MDAMTDAIESTLPPYTADRPRCTKCGHDKAGTRWTQAFNQCDTLLNAETTYGSQQRMCRRCERCGYHWDEAIATNDQTAPFRDRAPLGQQFRTNLAYFVSGETHLILTHTPSGLTYTISHPRPQLAEAAEQHLQMFQTLLDQVDEWQRQPIDTTTKNGETR